MEFIRHLRSLKGNSFQANDLPLFSLCPFGKTEASRIIPLHWFVGLLTFTEKQIQTNSAGRYCEYCKRMQYYSAIALGVGMAVMFLKKINASTNFNRYKAS